MEKIKKEESNSLKLFLDFNINTKNKLFNYSNNKKISKNYKIKEEIVYCCKNTEALENKNKNFIIFNSNQQEIKEEHELIFKIRKSKNNYYELIYPLLKLTFNDYDKIEQLDDRMWYVFKSENQDNKYENENDSYNLLENDIIKFGQAKFEIIKKHISSSSIENKNILNQINIKFGSVFDKFYPEFDENYKSYHCIICNDVKSSEQNPKIKLCKCGYIHYECLKKSFKENNIIEKENVTSYKYEEFNCKKCESPYPLNFYINNKEYSLIDLKIPENNDYIILENLNSLSEKNGIKQNSKNIFVIKLTEKEITIGRNEKNDIIINDQSISGEHCILKYYKNNGFLTIVDKSRNGTFVLIKGNAKLLVEKKLYFQTGNIFIKAEVKEEKNE